MPDGRLSRLIAVALLAALGGACTSISVAPREEHVFGAQARVFNMVVREDGKRSAGQPIQVSLTPAAAHHPPDCATVSGTVPPTNRAGASSVVVKGKPDLDTDCVAVLEARATNLGVSDKAIVIVHPRALTETFAGDPRNGSVTVWSELAVANVWRWLVTTRNGARVRRVEIRVPEDISSCTVVALEFSPQRLRPVVTQPNGRTIVVELPRGTPATQGWSRISVDVTCVETAYVSRLETTFEITPVTGQNVVIPLLPGPKAP